MRHIKQAFTPNAALVDELYRKHVQTLLRFVRRQVGSLEEAEDIVLEVFIAALESETLAELKEQEQTAWLYRVTLNKCSDYHRRSVRRPAAIPLAPLIDHLYDDEYEPANITVQQEEYMLLRKHLAQLTEQQRAILRLKFGDNLHSPEIARRLNKSESAVRMMLALTLSFLRDIYTRNGERREH